MTLQNSSFGRRTAFGAGAALLLFSAFIARAQNVSAPEFVPWESDARAAASASETESPRANSTIAPSNVASANNAESSTRSSVSAPNMTSANAENADGKAVMTPKNVEAMTAISRLLRDGEWPEAARRLKQMQRSGIDSAMRDRWNTLASRTALRLGDAVWLREINRGGNASGQGDELLILSAMRFLLAAQPEQARQTLKQVRAPEKLTIIPHRRYMQLQMKLEQMENRPQTERVWARRLVDYVTRWSSETCQSCHSNPRKYGDAVTTFDLKNWWVGARYSKLIRESGEASRVRSEAEATLVKNPHDGAARLRLVYALRALGDTEASDTQMRAFAWAAFPDRETRQPLRFGTFP